MIHDSIKSIAMIIESSKEKKDRQDNKNIHKTKTRKVKKKDLKHRPPRKKVRKVVSENKKHKTVSFDEQEEQKDIMPNFDVNIGNWENDNYDAFNTFLEAPIK